MAWFDVLGGIGAGLEKAALTGLELDAKRKAEALQRRVEKRQDEQDRRALELYNRELKKEDQQTAMLELAAAPDEYRYTAAEAADFIKKGIPKATFSPDPNNPSLLKRNRSLAEQAQDIQSRRVLEEEEARKRLEDPEFSKLPLHERLTLATKAKVPITAIGLNNREMAAALQYIPEFIQQTAIANIANRPQPFRPISVAGGYVEQDPSAPSGYRFIQTGQAPDKKPLTQKEILDLATGMVSKQIDFLKSDRNILKNVQKLYPDDPGLDEYRKLLLKKAIDEIRNAQTTMPPDQSAPSGWVVNRQPTTKD